MSRADLDWKMSEAMAAWRAAVKADDVDPTEATFAAVDAAYNKVRRLMREEREMRRPGAEKRTAERRAAARRNSSR